MFHQDEALPRAWNVQVEESVFILLMNKYENDKKVILVHILIHLDSIQLMITPKINHISTHLVKLSSAL